MPSQLKFHSFLQTRDKLQATKAHVSKNRGISHAFLQPEIADTYAFLWTTMASTSQRPAPS